MLPASKVRFQGFVYALSAALLWGLVPVYIDVVSDFDPMEIVVHRALWSGVLLWLFILHGDSCHRRVCCGLIGLCAVDSGCHLP